MEYLLTGKEMKSWEKKTMETYKTPSLLLMERAAQAVIKEILNGSYDLHKVLVVCGTGNNGGDGLAVARMLHMQGVFVEVYQVGENAKFTVETKQQIEMYEAISGRFVTRPHWDEYTVIVDGILGIGCNREISGELKTVIEQINHSRATVIAIDIPTGVSADTGKICGCGVNAATTVTFFTKKLGMMLYPGRMYCGNIITESLEVPFDVTEECRRFTYTEQDYKRLPKRPSNGHKGTFGKVLVIAGSKEICGAAYLAAAGAYKIGAGLVKIFTPKENKNALQVLLPEALLAVYDETDAGDKLKTEMKWADVIVIGPGIGTTKGAEAMLRYVLENSEIPVVIDADGINLLTDCTDFMKKTKAQLILTPHILEMSRLCHLEKEKLLEDILGAAEQFAANYPVTLVLKDARTVVAKEKELLYINTSGNSGMATGGSGDVLAGMIGGLLAQGIQDVEAARLGVFLHGMAGDAAGKKKSEYSMTASDLLDGIAEVTGL